MPTVQQNFLGLPPKLSNYARAAYAVLPVPYDGTASYRKGAQDGPAAILAASQQVEWFDEELQREPCRTGIATLAPLEPGSAGPDAVHEKVYGAARRIVRDGKFLLGLGGEHGITSALVRAAMGRRRTLSVLQIDAHADLRNSYQGSRFSHASVMRRVLELGADIVVVGLRSLSAECSRVLRSRGTRVTAICARECLESANWIARAVAALGPRVYVTVDIDGFDPAYAPGTGTPEPGGLDWHGVCSLLRTVAAARQIIGADVVEVAPIAGQHTTEFLAARLAYKLIGYHRSSC